MDAYIDQRPQAMTYLKGNFIETLGQGVLQWDRK